MKGVIKKEWYMRGFLGDDVFSLIGLIFKKRIYVWNVLDAPCCSVDTTTVTGGQSPPLQKRVTI
jgi:hypothetical protein